MTEDENLPTGKRCTMELRHVQLAARPQGYLSCASSWRGMPPFFQAGHSPDRVFKCAIHGRAAAGSLTLDVCRFEDRPPFLDLGLVVGRKRPGVLLLARRNLLAKIAKPLAHAGVGEGIDHGCIQLDDDLLRSALGHPERVPARNLEPR